MSKPLELDGAAAVLTGAGSGIGRATALAFAQRGASVVVSDLSEQRVAEVVEQIGALGYPVVGLPVDVTVEAELEKLRDTALERFGRIDLVMNNVGVLAIGAPEMLPDEAWRRIIDVNLFSIARSNRVFLPGLIAQGSGHVVNTASASGLLGYGFDRLPYVASKHAIVGMSEALATYLGPKGIGVTCLCPSGVVTNILEGITAYGEVDVTPVAPAHQIVSAEDVGNLTADAVEAGRFLVVTAPEVHDALLERPATSRPTYRRASKHKDDTASRWVRGSRVAGRPDGSQGHRRRVPHDAVGSKGAVAQALRRYERCYATGLARARGGIGCAVPVRDRGR